MVDQTPQTPAPGKAPALTGAFARKVRLSAWSLAFERFWPRLWVLLGLTALFVIVSLSGLWSLAPDWIHVILLAAFALAAIAAAVFAVRVPWPTRDEAIRRIERRSGIAHRPASSYEDTLNADGSTTETKLLWQAHRERLAAAIKKLRVGRPSPRADRFDPFAVRALALLMLIPAGLLVSGGFGERLLSAFRFGASDVAANARLDAWITPPPYTAVPPIMLADGGAAPDATPPAPKLIEVPERSLLTLRGVGFSGDGISLEVLNEGASAPIRVEPEAAKDAAKAKTADDKLTISEVQFEIKTSAIIRALAGSRELGQWTFGVIPDQLPKIELSKQPERTPRGSLKLTYKGEDDYGVASGELKLRQAPAKQGDQKLAWAKAEPLTGPRLPLEKPPTLALKIPKPGEKALDASTLLELGEHPWAGSRVEMWLEVTDVGGQLGRSAATEMILPQRIFRKPLARALVEQRRKLAEDSRNAQRVALALDALTMEPEGFIEKTRDYLGLRTAFHRLGQPPTRETMKETIDQLWRIALSIEDGDLSDAERALKDAQDKLADALKKEDTTDEELQAAINDLKQKLNDYLKEMQKQAQQNQDGEQNQDQQDQPQELGQNDLEQMMKDLEKNAQEGSREEAEKMLSDLKELMERLQAGNTPEQKAEQKRAQEAMKKLNMLGDLAGQQQKLMDETFGEQKKQDGGEQQQGGTQDGQQGQDGQQKNSKPGKQGQGGQQPQQGQDGQQAEQGGGAEQGEGQEGKEGQGGERRKSEKGEKGLAERQAGLRKELEKLKKDLEELGIGDADKLGKAEDSMSQAEESLENKDLQEAAEAQSEALQNMRESAKSMAEQMQKNAQQKMGQGGDQPRDPMGRPQPSKGPEVGQSVKVPNAIDAQRAREILDELRKRSSESLRPPVELDYLERLLKRF